MFIQWQSVQNSIQHIIHSGLNFISVHPHWGFFFAFMIAFTESLPIIGTVIPGSVTMTAIGTLIGTGVLPGISTLFFAVMGAFIGDSIGYYLGYAYHAHIQQLKWVKNNPHWLKKGKHFFQQHGGKSILIGRFVGPIRSTIPLIAGLLKMAPKAFVIAAIPSALLWSILYTLPGITLGALAMDMPKGKIAQFIFFGLLLIASAWFIVWCIAKLLSKLYYHYRLICKNYWKASQGPIHQLLQIPNQADNNINLRRLFTLISFTATFLILWLQTATGWGLARLNWPVLYFLRSLQTPSAMSLFAQLSLFGNKFVLMGFTVLISSWWTYKKDYRAAVSLTSGFALAFIAIGFMKAIFHHPRPAGLLVTASSSSFPSGHVTLATTCFLLVAYLLSQTQSDRIKQWYNSIAIILIGSVAFSRLFLGMHWLCDVLAGFCLGFAIVCFIQIAESKRIPKPNKKSIWPILLAIGLPLLALRPHLYPKTRHDTQIKNHTVIISLNNWWQNATHYVPPIRFNRLHQPVQPINIQWLGSLKDIKQQLKNWEIIKPKQNNLGITLKEIARPSIEYQQGLLPPLYDFKVAVLRAYLYKNNKLMILTLWPSQIQINHLKNKLWVGNLSIRQPSKQLFKRYYYHSISAQELPQSLIGKQTIKIVRHTLNDKIIKKLNWRGEVTLIKLKNK